ncbi:MAG: hypothetical protein CFE44_09745 [Burkholderiales bacterium PBB4]|nr:MAG: hypothetical protein CFE44_09745 [Burkholderiales bacterium PBB4]
MAFFKKYNGTTNTKLVRMERLVWVLIYGGLLSFVLGHFVSATDEALARTMGIAGLVAVVAGAVLIYVRSRLREGKD